MSYFEQNLAIMTKRDPELAALMRSDLDCRHIEVLPSHQPGVPTVRVQRPSGEAILLHNSEDPIGSAVRWTSGRQFLSENGSIVLGLGLGYLAREIVRHAQPKHSIIICELDPALLKTAMTHVDLTEVLDSDYIRILAGSDIALEPWIHTLSTKFMTARVDVISYGPSASLAPAEYDRLARVAQNESRAIILNRNTVLKAGRQMMENLLINMPDVLQSAGIKQLENLFKGRPAILVSAGPSLEKNVHLLREAKGRAVIIAVDTAVRLLLPLGIKPDIITTIDFNAVNFEKFRDVPVDDDIALVYHPGCYHEAIQSFHGPRFTSTRVSNRIPAWLLDFVEDKGALQGGTTVAHLSFFLARHMGCDPIVMVGQDLAFPDKRVHASDLSLWSIRGDEMETIEDIFGEPVGSMTSFKHAIYHFEKAFKETAATIIDATEGGAKKQGAHVMRLRDVLEEYCRGDSVDVTERLRMASTHVEAVRMDAMLEEMASVSRELRTIKSEAKAVLALAKKLKRKIANGETHDSQFAEMSQAAEEMTEAMNRHGRVLHLIGEHNFGLELYMVHHKVAQIDDMEDPYERIAEQLDRAAIYYPSIQRAADIFQKPLDRLIRRLKTARQLDADPLTDTAPAGDWYRRALAYSKIECREEAYRACAAALVRQPGHLPALMLRLRLALATNRLADAMATARAIEARRPGTRTAARLIADARKRHTAWTTRARSLKTQFRERERPDTLEEAGWFYYRTKSYDRAVEKWDAAAEVRPSAETYARLGHARMAVGEREAAMEAWAKALALDPSRADVYKQLGAIALDQGLSEQAEDFLAEACRLEPDDHEVQEALARMLCARGAYAEAGFCYENVLRLNPNRQELIPQIVALYQRQIELAASTQ